MSSEKLGNVLSEIVYDLLCDIAAGHGDELIEAPVLDDSIKGLEACCISELVQFWEGKPVVTRYLLFANILKHCSKEIDIIEDITATIISAYPNNETKLSSNSILESIKHYYTSEAEPAKKVAAKETPAPAPVKEAEKVENAFGKEKPNYMLAKNSAEHSANNKEHQEMLEAKRALAAERAALNS